MGASGFRGVRAAASRTGTALVVAALATAVALVWLLGRTVDLSHTNGSDAQLGADLQIARATLAEDVAAAARRATALANLTRTRIALARNDGAGLRRLASSHPGALLVAAGGARGGSLSPLGVRRVAEVVAGETTIGRVLTEAALDAGYVQRVRSALPTGVHDLLAVTDRGRVVAGALPPGTKLPPAATGNVHVAGRDYRALSAPLADDRAEVGIVALAPRTGGFLSGWRLPLAVLATLAALFLAVAWLAAPRRSVRRASVARGGRRLPGSVALLGETLAATHDEDALLEVIRNAAVEATNAADARLVRGAAPEWIAGTLTIALETSNPGGSSILLFPPPRGFTPEAAAAARWLGNQGSTALRNAHRHVVAERHALTDDLTGLANRRRFTAALHAELSRAERFATPLAVLLADLDGFKAINDRYGHVAGDEVLRTFARTLERCVREIDLAARFGGDEFAVLLPQTDAAGAEQVAERLRAELRSATGLPAPVTSSFGVAQHPPAAGADDLLARADACLYRAKHAGRDMVVVDAQASRGARR